MTNLIEANESLDFFLLFRHTFSPGPAATSTVVVVVIVVGGGGGILLMECLSGRNNNCRTKHGHRNGIHCC